MSAKERAQNFRHKRIRKSCLSSCFSGSFVDEPDDDLESTSDSSVSKTMSRKSKWFSSSRLGKRKKKNMAEVHHAPINSLSHEIHKAIGKKALTKPEQEISTASDQTTTLPHISVKYNTGSPPVQPNQTRTRSKPTIRTDSLETNQQSIEQASHSSEKTVPKLHAVVGLSLLVATLATMLMFGRAFAIAWLSACFYLLPLLRTATIATEGGNGTEENIHAMVDTDSKEYKKRVVLEGLLERDEKRISKVHFGKGLPGSGIK